ncbi:hypothetical protein [Achromobacter sp. NFACC18-2]|uniref:hypothetical protein n=1 Tax=Achromobacter sp. NFACC18-2 TaxID=1564112 RepID=UPI0011139013
MPANEILDDARNVFSKDSPYVHRYDPSFPVLPDPKYSIDSMAFRNAAGHNAEGFPRDAGGFWRKWLELEPSSIGKNNRMLIESYDRLKV